jgi:hypothetical protein
LSHYRNAEDAEAGGEQWAEPMINYHNATLSNINEILDTHTGPEGEEGEMIRPFKDGRSLAAT